MLHLVHKSFRPTETRLISNTSTYTHYLCFSSGFLIFSQVALHSGLFTAHEPVQLVELNRGQLAVPRNLMISSSTECYVLHSRATDYFSELLDSALFNIQLAHFLFLYLYAWRELSRADIQMPGNSWNSVASSGF